MDEIWKDIYYVDIVTDEIIDYRGKYQISNFGRVKSLNYNRSRKEKELNYTKDKDGYLIVSLNRRKFKVHRLVAYVFIANDKKEKWQINHKDEDVANNHINNLEWCSPKYNCNYGGHNKRVSESKKGSIPWNRNIPCREEVKEKISTTKKNKKISMNEDTKQYLSKKYKGKNNPNAKKVRQYDVNGNLIKIWDCAKEISNFYNWNYNTFYAHLSGKKLKSKNPHEYKGYLWYFDSDNYSLSEK